MKRQEVFTLLKNSLSNVLRGASATLVALILPPFLTRYMTPSAFGTWSLILQLAAYVSYLDFGGQIALARFVAHATETGDTDRRDAIISTAIVVLGVSGAVAGLLLGLGVAFMPKMFPQMPPSLFHDARVALLLVGGSLAIGLPATVFGGALVGLQRNEIPAAVIGGSRLLIALMLIVAVRHGAGIAEMGAITAAVNIASYAVQYLFFRQIVRGHTVKIALATAEGIKEMIAYCAGVSVWLLGMLMVSGLDLTIVGYFQFQAVAYYAVAASAVAVIVGVQNAIFSAMISSAAVLHARGNSGELGALVTTATRYGMYLLLLSGIPLVVYAGPVISLWMGHSYSGYTAPLLRWLVVANVIRLSLTPYSVAVLATGQQRIVLLSPVLEGITNLSFSVVAAHYIGAMGVAIGTFIGAIVGVAIQILFNMRRTRSIELAIGQYVEGALALPVACCVPLMLAAAAGASGEFSLTARIGALMLGGAFTSACVWRWGLKDGERSRIREWAVGLV